jgi:hypothetical protein
MMIETVGRHKVFYRLFAQSLVRRFFGAMPARTSVGDETRVNSENNLSMDCVIVSA